MKSKNFFSNLSKSILGISEEEIEEFDKANIILKTVRLKENNLPKKMYLFLLSIIVKSCQRRLDYFSFQRYFGT